MKKLSLTETTKLATRTYNCIQYIEAKIDQIMYEKVTQSIGCNLPWAHYKNESQENCQTETDYESYFNASYALQSQIADIPSKCKQNSWVMTHFFEERNWTHPSFEYEIYFLGQDLRVTMEEENYQYGFNDFIGDFGGYLGLFLGGSFIGLYEIVEDFMEKLRQRRSISQSG